MEKTLTLSMQKSPKEGFVRIFAFDVNPDTMEMMLSHTKDMNKEEYEYCMKLLTDFIEQANESDAKVHAEEKKN